MRIAMTIVLIVILAAPSVMAQDKWTPGVYMNQAIQNITTMSQYAASLTGYGYNWGVCVMGSFLDVSEQVGWTVQLEGGVEYMFLGGGDEDAQDIDISIYSSSNKLMEQDVETDATPIVAFTPPVTDNYSIYLKLYSADVASFCSMAILRKGGYDIPLNRLSEASERLLTFGSAVNSNTGGVYFHNYDNQWCLYGVVLNSGEDVTITNIDLGSENHWFMGRSDSVCDDADLYLLDSSGNELVQDTATDDMPLLNYQTKAGERYGLKIRNYSSSGPSMIMTGILTQ